MKICKSFRMYELLDESIQLTNDQEKLLLKQFLTYCNNSKSNKNSIEQMTINVLNRLFEADKFHIQLINRNDPQEKDISRAYGYYSAYENNIYIVIDKSNFQKKWLGFFINYNALLNTNFDLFINTCVHELMHYACNNYYINFLKLWRPTFRQYIWNVFANIIEFYFADFVDAEVFAKMTKEKFITDPAFKMAYDTYFNSLIINIRFKLSSLSKRYNDVLSTLYSKHNFIYARFFDNVLINAIKLQNGNYTNTSLKLYNAIHKSYIDLEPALKNIRMNELFYQEILDFSEIACVFASYYKYVPRYYKLIEQTLDLIKS